MVKKSMEQERPIGVFDSGLGGISVLKTLRKELPAEDFIYYGDAANAPYGDRSETEIRALTLASVEYVAAQNIKALVIACNTATSAAAEALRQKYDFPVIGMEPALKPAAQIPGSRVLVMATCGTLRQRKFAELLHIWGEDVKVISLPCPGLVELIESGGPGNPDIYPYLQKLLAPYVGQVDAVVLGCTHYPFVQDQILKVLGDIPVHDGRNGTARQLVRRLKEQNLQRTNHRGTVCLQSSCPGSLALAEQLMNSERKE